MVLTGEVCLGLPKLSLLCGTGLPILSFLPESVGGLPKLSLLAGTEPWLVLSRLSLRGDDLPSLAASDNLPFIWGEPGGDWEKRSNDGSFFKFFFLIGIGLFGGVVKSSSFSEACDEDSDTTVLESDLESLGLRLLIGEPVLGESDFECLGLTLLIGEPVLGESEIRRYKHFSWIYDNSNGFLSILMHLWPSKLKYPWAKFSYFLRLKCTWWKLFQNNWSVN